MKAITIWQPWASLIIAGAKPYEFRHWPVPRSLRGKRIVNHAGVKRVDRQEVNILLHVLDQRDRHPIDAAETWLIPEKAIPILEAALRNELPLGAGIGTMIVGSPRNGLDIAAEFGVPRANDSDRDEHANWGWPMTDIEIWPQPIPARGAQGFWNWPIPEGLML